MKIFFLIIFLLFLALRAGAFSVCTPDLFIKSVNPENVIIGQEINGEMIVELSCTESLCYFTPVIDYGDGTGEHSLGGGECLCVTEDAFPVKNVRCSYGFNYKYDSAGEYIVTPKGDLSSDDWGGTSGVDYSTAGSGVRVNVLEGPPAPTGSGADNPLSTSTIPGLVKIGTRIIYIIAYALTVLFIMIGGFMIITSSGNPEQITKGKKIVLYTIIAFSILIVARGIVNLILMIIDVPTRI